MVIIAEYLEGGFIHENSSAYGKNSSLLTLDELLNLYIFPLLGFVSTIYAWCSVLRAGTSSQEWCLTQLANYCSNESFVFIPLWNSYFFLLSAVGCCLRDLLLFLPISIGWEKHCSFVSVSRAVSLFQTKGFVSVGHLRCVKAVLGRAEKIPAFPLVVPAWLISSSASDWSCDFGQFCSFHLSVPPSDLCLPIYFVKTSLI